ncbi:hypothetical protein [Legionella tunisiensis]|uniref:hypothetical protein n=1 Tax=Legionella tunisiensis TaxID=1034944 RepID=UPI0002EF6278|nr:hypothetical protein [Legionella tunisiensis]
MARPKVVKDKDKRGLLPPAKAFGQIAEVATTIEAIDYACERARATFTQKGVINKAPTQSMLKKMDNVRQNVHFLRGQNSELWSGNMTAENPFENLQQNLAKQEVAVMNDKIQDKSVVMDYAFNDKGDFRRGIAIDGVEMDAKIDEDRETIEVVDNLFNTWLASHHYRSDDSVIYKIDENGGFTVGKNGKVRAEGGELSELMEGDNGFESYMQDQGIDMTTRQQSFPGEEPTVSKKQQQTVQPAAVQEVDIEEIPDYEGVRTPKS